MQGRDLPKHSNLDIFAKMKAVLLFLFLGLAWVAPTAAQELSALARFDVAKSRMVDAGSGLEVELAISQPVPWRLRVLDNPARLVMDFREVDWTGIEKLLVNSKTVMGLRAGVFRPGWSRLVVELREPMLVRASEMQTAGAVKVRLRLEPATAKEFAAKAAEAEPEAWALPKPADLPAPQHRGTGPLRVVLDPGHGGIDPGAERDGEDEASLMLVFARELKEVLLRDGNFEVVMTRESNVFVPLEARISVARAAGAHVFISLHADAISEGEAVGATVYTLSKDASDAASAALAERHDRDDLLAGVDLRQQDDLVAEVLLDMARTQTTPRTDRLAAALVSSIKQAGVKMHRHPHQEASFSVLKLADIPSVLLELGFLSSPRDLARLKDPEWRDKMAAALRDALKAWAKEDATLVQLPLK